MYKHICAWDNQFKCDSPFPWKIWPMCKNGKKNYTSFCVLFCFICVFLPKQGTVPLARDTTIVTSAISEEQITRLDEDNNGVVAVNVETKEKKWKVQLVRWEFTRSIILLGLFLAFDVWAALFYCFKTDVLTNILN